MDKVLSSEELQPLIGRFGRAAVKVEAAAELERLRAAGLAGDLTIGSVAERVSRALQEARAPSLRRVINATGVIIHTNLGRSPIDRELWDRAGDVVTGYSNLEYDLGEGERGARDEHVSSLAAQLFGCEAAILTNNNAAATLLLLASVAAGKEVIVSRGELVEIGGSFRVPEVIQQGGARLREVGTTNRTRASDYDQAISRRTAAILRVHRSNFDIVGFTERPEISELVAVARKKKRPVLYDEGTGAVVDLSRYGFSRTGTVRSALQQGVDAVTCSTDKLIGATQGGLISGSKEIVEACRRHPLMRALRVGKESFATIAETLQSFLGERFEREIPIYRMLSAPLEGLRARASSIVAATGGEVVETRAVLGGGTTPAESIASVGVWSRGDATKISRALLALETPVIARIHEDRCLLDVRTVLPEEDARLCEMLRGAHLQ